MRKAIVSFLIATGLTGFTTDQTTLNAELLTIKARASAESIAVIYNPDEIDLEGSKVSVKTVALPASNGTTLIQGIRSVVRQVDAIYLVKGRNLTTPKLANFVVKNASRQNVSVFSNDPALAEVPGVQIVQIGADGTVSVQEAAAD